MNDDIFDKPSEAEIDKIHEVDLKEKMETFYICLLYTSDAADE